MCALAAAAPNLRPLNIIIIKCVQIALGHQTDWVVPNGRNSRRTEKRRGNPFKCVTADVGDDGDDDDDEESTNEIIVAYLMWPSN